MTKSKGVGRGKNPNSHHNKPKVAGEGTSKNGVFVYLLPHQEEAIKQIGNGNKSEGVRRAVDLYCRDYSHIPYPGKVIALLQRAIASSEPEKTEFLNEALEYLESWAIEADYEEVVDGATKTPGGAYIV